MEDIPTPELGAVRWPDPRTENSNTYLETVTISPAPIPEASDQPVGRLIKPADFRLVTAISGRRMALNADLMLTKRVADVAVWGVSGAIAIVGAELDRAFTKDARRSMERIARYN